ncbi:MAG: hypothetical protein ACRYHQ_01845 [Janthinobacterium lividum]
MLLTSSGCATDPALERGRPPELALFTTAIAVPLDQEDPAWALQGAINELHGRDGLRARILASDPSRARIAWTRLVGLGIEPARITVAADPGDRVILTRTEMQSPSCATSLRPDWSGDVSDSVDSLGHCIAAADLAGMVYDPADLVAPARLQPAEGAASVQPVHQLEGSLSTPTALPSGATGGSRSQGSGGSPQSAPAGDNPLLSPAPLASPAGRSTE